MYKMAIFYDQEEVYLFLDKIATDNPLQFSHCIFLYKNILNCLIQK